MTQGSERGSGVWRLGPGKAPEPVEPIDPSGVETEDRQAAPSTAETRPRHSISTAPDPGRATPPGVAPTTDWQAAAPTRAASDESPTLFLDTAGARTSPHPSPLDSTSSPVRDSGRVSVSAPTPRHTAGVSPRWALGVVGAIVIAAAAFATGSAQQQSQVDPPTAVEPTVTDSTPAVVETTQESSLPSTTEVPTPSITTTDAEQTALEDLESLHQQDLTTLTISGQWVAQLSSKTVGILDPLQTAQNGTHTFRAADILFEHQELRNADNHGADIRLLLSTDYGKRQLLQGKPLWVTVAVDSALGSSADVETWCAQRFPTLDGDALKNVCVPRQLNPPT